MFRLVCMFSESVSCRGAFDVSDWIVAERAEVHALTRPKNEKTCTSFQFFREERKKLTFVKRVWFVSRAWVRGRLHLREQRCKRWVQSWFCGDDFAHTMNIMWNVRKWAICHLSDILGKNVQDLLWTSVITSLNTPDVIDPFLLPGVCNCSNNWCKVKCRFSLSFYSNTFFCHDGSHQLSGSNIEAGVIYST